MGVDLKMSERVQGVFEAKIRKVVRAYERGTTVKDIAARVGVSAPTVSKWLTEEGYKHKKRGRIPLAMKARVRDLSQRGWSDEQIVIFLRLSPMQVAEFSKPQRNPVLGGEKDPLKVKGERTKKKGKSKSRKRRRVAVKKKGADWPPPRHRCRKHWSPVEEAFVIELMEKKVPIMQIYKRMRASRQRQLRIWRKFGNKGMPPNFPPPKGPPPRGPTLPPAEAKHRREEVRALEKSGAEQIRALETAAAERQGRIAQLEAEAAEDEQRLRALEERRRSMAAELRKSTKQLAEAEAVMDKRRGALPSPGPRRVIPGSYEAEVLGLRPGTVVEPKARPRKAMPSPGFGQYADNGRYFAVSREWADLHDATPDELALFADFLRLKKFPARVEKRGDQPKAFFESSWPKTVETKWNNAVEKGLDLLEEYQSRKSYLKSQKMFTKQIARYLARAYDAYRNPKLTKSQKAVAREELQDDWARTKKIDRLVMVFSMKVADRDGAPTSIGIDRGFQAKALLEKSSRTAARKLEEKAKRASKKRTLAKKEEDDVASMLSGARVKLALPEGE